MRVKPNTHLASLVGEERTVKQRLLDPGREVLVLSSLANFGEVYEKNDVGSSKGVQSN